GTEDGRFKISGSRRDEFFAGTAAEKIAALRQPRDGKPGALTASAVAGWKKKSSSAAASSFSSPVSAPPQPVRPADTFSCWAKSVATAAPSRFRSALLRFDRSL